MVRVMIDYEAYIAMTGKEIGLSEWHVMDQKRIDAFAAATEDHQFIHVDPARAGATPF
ncbi:MAG: MaoC/PaaZ C-terminal domain-containing protein, partial [Tardiphaga sp.]